MPIEERPVFRNTDREKAGPGQKQKLPYQETTAAKHTSLVSPHSK